MACTIDCILLQFAVALASPASSSRSFLRLMARSSMSAARYAFRSAIIEVSCVWRTMNSYRERFHTPLLVSTWHHTYTVCTREDCLETLTHHCGKRHLLAGKFAFAQSVPFLLYHPQRNFGEIAGGDCREHDRPRHVLFEYR
jgi:hypothetical protein